MSGFWQRSNRSYLTRSTLHEILFLGIDILCCRPDAAQAGRVNSLWPPSSRASCFHRVLKLSLSLRRQLNPGGYTAALPTAPARGQPSCKGSLGLLLLQDFCPGAELGTSWGTAAAGQAGLAVLGQQHLLVAAPAAPGLAWG